MSDLFASLQCSPVMQLLKHFCKMMRDLLARFFNALSLPLLSYATTVPQCCVMCVGFCFCVCALLLTNVIRNHGVTQII